MTQDATKKDFIELPEKQTNKIVKYFDKETMRKRDEGGYIADDYPNFTPDYSPLEILDAGAFGGTYFRTIQSGVLGKELKADSSDAIGGLPKEFKGRDQSQKEDVKLNKFKKHSGQSLQEWEKNNWIEPIDPYGWFQWYCRFYYGRRSYDDIRQIDRWKSFKSRNGNKTQDGWKQGLLHWAIKEKS